MRQRMASFTKFSQRALAAVLVAATGLAFGAPAANAAPRTPSPAATTPSTARTVSTQGAKFLIDGKPVQIISGEIHPARIPRPYWLNRLKMAKAMGLNAVTIYVMWNELEPSPGVWNFSGRNDIAEFVRLAQQEGLYVILRPGPYVCAEWSFGGFPDWLLQDPNMRVRSLYPGYIKAATSYIDHLGQQLVPLLWSHGGPIIAVQVENEYGSWGHNKAYLAAVKNMLVKAGFGSVLLYTGDGPDELPGGTIAGVPAAIDVGPGGVIGGFKKLAAFRPNQQWRYIAEFYPGWFDQWGHPHHTGAPIAEQLKDLNWLLSRGYSVSLYMFNGGTDWGFMNGANANADGSNYNPQTTSYDYSAPLNESGRPTPDYYAFRKLFAKYRPGVKLPPVPTPPPLITVAPFHLAKSASLFANLPNPVHSEEPLDFAHFNIATGYMLYRTTLPGPTKGVLDVGEARDYDVVYINGKEVGTLDRRLNQHELTINVPGNSAQLEILDEDTGRINFGHALANDRQGLVFPVTFNGAKLTNWENYPLRLAEPPSNLKWGSGESSAPAFHRGTFTLTSVGDTFLNVSALGKGLLWVNGHAIGRIWNIGPQQSDYVPGCWLRKGVNTVTVFDLEPEHNPTISGVTHHVYAVHNPAQ